MVGTAVLAAILLSIASDPERQGFIRPPPGPPTVIRLPAYLVRGIGVVCFGFSLYTAGAVVAARHAATALQRR